MKMTTGRQMLAMILIMMGCLAGQNSYGQNRKVSSLPVMVGVADTGTYVVAVHDSAGVYADSLYKLNRVDSVTPGQVAYGSSGGVMKSDAGLTYNGNGAFVVSNAGNPVIITDNYNDIVIGDVDNEQENAYININNNDHFGSITTGTNDVQINLVVGIKQIISGDPNNTSTGMENILNVESDVNCTGDCNGITNNTYNKTDDQNMTNVLTNALALPTMVILNPVINATMKLFATYRGAYIDPFFPWSDACTLVLYTPYYDGEEQVVYFGGYGHVTSGTVITALTISYPDGKIVGPTTLTALQAGSCIHLKYRQSTNAWYVSQ